MRIENGSDCVTGALSLQARVETPEHYHGKPGTFDTHLKGDVD